MTSSLQKISYSPEKTDFAQIGLEQGPRGHVYSPWFTYDHHEEVMNGKMTYGWFSGRVRGIIERATTEFARALNISPGDVCVTQMPLDHNTGEAKWRLGTAHPCQLPKPPQRPKPSGDFIDVEASSVPTLRIKD